MDKEQAIEIIETHSDDISSSSLLGRALNMAIEALKAQLSQQGTTKDAISRQAAIDALNEYFARIGKLKRRGLTEGEKAISLDTVGTIKTLPPAQPEPQWIPVSERLPEDLSEVNVTWINRNPESYYESIKDKPFTATAVYYKGKWYWWSTYTQDLLAEYGERCSVGLLHEAIEVTAWMPLPEPYKPNEKQSGKEGA